MTLATLIVLSALAFPKQFPDPPMPPQFPTEAKAGACGLAGCDCGCSDGGLCTCRPDGMKATARRLPPTYTEWKAGLKRRPVVIFAPVSLPFRTAPMMSFGPSFGGGFAGAACRGGG